MKIDVREEGLVTVLTLEGDFVIGGPENEFDRAVTQLLEDRHVNLLIDLGSVRRLDSSALDAMVRALAGSQKEGGVTKLVHITPRIGRLLEITKLSSVFETYDDQKRAIASFQPPL